MREQLLKSKIIKLEIEVVGPTLNDVVANIFKVMRKRVYDEVGKPIIQMGTDSVYFNKIDVEKTTERFLFLFMPREVKKYTVVAEVIVDIKYLDVSEEEF